MRMIDRVAYINHDIDDAVRAGLLREDELPGEPIAVLGDSGSARIDALVHDMVEHSAAGGRHRPGRRGRRGDGELRDFMFERVYLGPGGARRAREDRERRQAAVRALRRAPELLPPSGRERRLAAPEEELAERVTDYLAGMTDRYCIRAYTELQVPQAFAR